MVKLCGVILLTLFLVQPVQAQISGAIVGGSNTDGAQMLVWVDVGDKVLIEPWSEHYQHQGWQTGVDAIAFNAHYVGLTAGFDSDGGFRIGPAYQLEHLQLRVTRHFHPDTWQGLAEYYFNLTSRTAFYVWYAPPIDRSSQELLVGFSYTLKR